MLIGLKCCEGMARSGCELEGVYSMSRPSSYRDGPGRIDFLAGPFLTAFWLDPPDGSNRACQDSQASQDLLDLGGGGAGISALREPAARQIQVRGLPLQREETGWLNTSTIPILYLTTSNNRCSREAESSTQRAEAVFRSKHQDDIPQSRFKVQSLPVVRNG